ncbi:hypothetical protein [Nocardia sp. NPDC047648]|uniref:hypothetical protein n=1 Tax=Nocardia sp. NPDC047648 TaxID=3155625 RepID=UPI0033C7252D
MTSPERRLTTTVRHTPFPVFRRTVRNRAPELPIRDPTAGARSAVLVRTPTARRRYETAARADLDAEITALTAERPDEVR